MGGRIFEVLALQVVDIWPDALMLPSLKDLSRPVKTVFSLPATRTDPASSSSPSASSASRMPSRSSAPGNAGRMAAGTPSLASRPGGW